jgi:hypothetical protein
MRSACSGSCSSTLMSRTERSAPIETVVTSPIRPSPSAIARQTRASMPVRCGCSMRKTMSTGTSRGSLSAAR